MNVYKTKISLDTSISPTSISGRREYYIKTKITLNTRKQHLLVAAKISAKQSR